MTKGKPSFVKAFWQRKKQLWQFRKLVLEKYRCPEAYVIYSKCLSEGRTLGRLDTKYSIHPRANKAFVLDWFLHRWPEHKQQDIAKIRALEFRYFNNLFYYFRCHLGESYKGWWDDLPTAGPTAYRQLPLPPFHDMPNPQYVVGCARDEELPVVMPVYDVLADKYPKYAAAWLNKAELRRRQGKKAEAMVCAQKAVDVCEAHPEYSPVARHKNKDITTMVSCYLARMEGGNTDEPLLDRLGSRLKKQYGPYTTLEEREEKWPRDLIMYIADIVKFKREESLALLVRLNRAYPHVVGPEKAELAAVLLGAEYPYGSHQVGPFPSELDVFDDCFTIAMRAHDEEYIYDRYKGYQNTEFRKANLDRTDPPW